MMEVQNQKGECSNEIEFYFRPDQHLLMDLSCGGSGVCGYGNAVIIDHGNGLQSLYGHNSSLTVSVGETVSQGQVIAYAGSTGYSTGPHCHFEVRQNGEAVDPMGYL